MTPPHIHPLHSRHMAPLWYSHRLPAAIGKAHHLSSMESPAVNILHVAWTAWDTFLQKSPMDSQGLRLIVLRLLASPLATLLHEEGLRQMGMKSAIPWCHYSERFSRTAMLKIFSIN